MTGLKRDTVKKFAVTPRLVEFVQPYHFLSMQLNAFVYQGSGRMVSGRNLPSLDGPQPQWSVSIMFISLSVCLFLCIFIVPINLSDTVDILMLLIHHWVTLAVPPTRYRDGNRSWRHVFVVCREKNCRDAIEAAERLFKIPMVVSPKHFSSPDLDELSGVFIAGLLVL